MESDRYFDCTQRIFQKYPDLPDVFVKKCVHGTFQRATYEVDCVKTLKWCIEQNIGLDPIYAEELNGDPDPFSYDEINCGMSAVHFAATMKALPIDVLASAVEKRLQDINRPSESGDTPSPWPSPRTTMTLSRSAYSWQMALTRKHVPPRNKGPFWYVTFGDLNFLAKTIL
ncbi:hypothetical protein PG996_011125 [Apiospora saccharicola]|uniref:Uncharacterized protein n=1 Tax=Apiospora saccharicola TaxID=335842 RepID=A0ABR1UE58_9PEZI